MKDSLICSSSEKSHAGQYGRTPINQNSVILHSMLSDLSAHKKVIWVMVWMEYACAHVAVHLLFCLVDTISASSLETVSASCVLGYWHMWK